MGHKCFIYGLFNVSSTKICFDNQCVSNWSCVIIRLKCIIGLTAEKLNKIFIKIKQDDIFI